ncbi:hypothetical protein [Rhizobium sp. NPDC090279]|uniref:hypothetical protein n=1 Tax=Rhizobium sp. NPDC090279 TaxID=3364499 RepID=UPI00383B6BA0
MAAGKIILDPLLSDRKWRLRRGTDLVDFPDKFLPGTTTAGKVLKLYRAASNACNYGTITIKDDDGDMLFVNSSNPYGMISLVFKASGGGATVQNQP